MRGLIAVLIDGIIIVVVAAGGYWLYLNHNQILDWYFLRNYHPSAQIATLADQAALTQTGRNLFYRANPQIDETRSQMVRDCNIVNDKTIELGCYLTSDHIYLLNITQSELQNEMIVTAAHETLHAAYDRLSRQERQRIDAQLEQVAAGITDPSLKQRLADYQTLEPGQEDNELHSILGTEYANLPPELEAYYAKYFTNRAQIVSYSDQFNQTFDGLHTQIVQLGQQIDTTKQRMQMYLGEGDVRAYNNLVPVVNNDINTYNQEVQQYNQYASELLGTQTAASAQ